MSGIENYKGVDSSNILVWYRRSIIYQTKPTLYMIPNNDLLDLVYGDYDIYLSVSWNGILCR